jgi:hypothetical protein
VLDDQVAECTGPVDGIGSGRLRRSGTHRAHPMRSEVHGPCWPRGPPSRPSSAPTSPCSGSVRRPLNDRRDRGPLCA